VLFLHLKRFTYGSFGPIKLNTRVSFPIRDLDVALLAPAADSPLAAALGSSALPRYDLYAVAHHSGSASGGHYTAHCRSVDGRKWFLFNDSRVTLSDESALCSSSAYVLCFMQRGFKWASSS
jgi:ubiquitin C-terminal hydrolase